MIRRRSKSQRKEDDKVDGRVKHNLTDEKDLTMLLKGK